MQWSSGGWLDGCGITEACSDLTPRAVKTEETGKATTKAPKPNENALTSVARSGGAEEVRKVLSAALHEPLTLQKALFNAALTGNAEAVNVLAEETSLLAVDDEGCTVAMAAIAGGHDEIALWLMEEGVPIDSVDRRGWTTLFFAADKGRPFVAEWLLSRHADANARAYDRQTALHAAAAAGRVDCAQLLLRARADPRAVDARLRAPGDVAVGACAPLLVGYGVGRHDREEKRAVRHDEGAELQGADVPSFPIKAPTNELEALVAEMDEHFERDLARPIPGQAVRIPGEPPGSVTSVQPTRPSLRVIPGYPKSEFTWKSKDAFADL